MLNLYIDSNIPEFSGGVITLPGPNGLKSFDSQMNLTRVFCGEYLDDFCLASIFSPNDSKDLVSLGASIGSSIRSACAVREFDSIFCVDIDRRAAESSKKIFTQMKGFDNIEWSIESAVDFLSRSTRRFHGVVLIDLFDQIGHAKDCFLENDCLAILADRVSDESVIQMNVYTIPTFLGLDSKSLQFFLSRVKRHFKYISLFPYRRNISMIFSNSPLRSSNQLNHSSLRHVDRLMLRMKQIVSCASLNVAASCQVNEKAIFFSDIRDEFKERHIQFCAKVQQKYGVNLLNQSDETLFFQAPILRKTLQMIEKNGDAKTLHFIVVSLAAQPEKAPDLFLIQFLREVVFKTYCGSDLNHMADQICAMAIKLMALRPMDRDLLSGLINSVLEELSNA